MVLFWEPSHFVGPSSHLLELMDGVWAELLVAPLLLAADSEDLPLNILIVGGGTLMNIVKENFGSQEKRWPGLRGKCPQPRPGSEAYARPGTKQMVW